MSSATVSCSPPSQTPQCSTCVLTNTRPRRLISDVHSRFAWLLCDTSVEHSPLDRMGHSEFELAGGRSTSGVVRVADTVRRPISANSDFVHGLLRHLETRGFKGAPRYLGLDEKGREVLSYLPGNVPLQLGEFTQMQWTAAAKLLRSLHDSTVDCDLRGNSDVICHGDPSPCNCVFVDGVPSGFIDFDAAHPGARREDLGYAAWLWLDIGNEDSAPMLQGRRLADFVSAYDLAAPFDSLQLIVSAQRELCSRLNCPPGTREWAQACLTWTERHYDKLLAGVGMRSNKGWGV